jgi:hypothetical protein
MDTESLAQALNDLQDFSEDSLELLATSKNAPMERRIGSILLIVGVSGLSISSATIDLICQITDPDWDEFPEDPRDTPLGKTFRRLLDDPPDTRAKTMGEIVFFKLVKLAEQSAPIPPPKMDGVLLKLTGKPALWWIDWIRDELSK